MTVLKRMRKRKIKRQLRKRKRAKNIEEEIGEPKKKRKKGEEKDKKVQATIDQLTEKHGESYMPMQYCVWAEMYISGVQPSVDNPPTSTTLYI